MEHIFEIISGYIEMDKKSFIKDMLQGSSILRSLINNKEPRFIEPVIVKGSETVKIVFDEATDIDIGEEYQDIFQELKKMYKERVTGKIVVRVTCYATFLSVVDFSRESDRILVY